MSLYFLDSPEALTKEQIGGKGFYLHQMHQDQLPIPEAAFLSTALWKEYQSNPKATTAKLKKDIIPQMIEYFKQHNNGVMPLVSVRSAGAVSMPGMMDTILNVGVSQKFFKEQTPPETTAKNAGKKSKHQTADHERFLADNYARFLSMYGQTVLGMDKSAFTHEKFATIADVQVQFEDIYARQKQTLPPQKVEDQLLQCIVAVFDSWNNDRAKLYRSLNKIDDRAGTAVVVQRMVFGNRNDQSATGVLFSRNPSTGQNALTGEYLINAQGEDVVSGSHTPQNIDDLQEEMPEAYEELSAIAQRLEGKYKQMQDIEFTIENNRVFILQARTAKCAPFAKLKMLMDLYKGGEIQAQEVLDSLSLKEYLELNIKQVDPSFARPADGEGLPASMGALTGRVVFGPSTKYKDDPTIFVAKETTPDDLQAIQLATGVLTASGGVTSHAAVVARGMGKVCVVGCSAVKITQKNGVDSASIGGVAVQSGDWITMDANTGKVWVGDNVPITDAQNTQIFWDLEDLVLDAHPQWTRVTSKVDELVRGKSSYYCTYPLDDADQEFAKAELQDAVQYLTGVMDMTGKLDFLQNKYAQQFLFADLSAEKAFLHKKKILLDLVAEQYDQEYDFEVYLGPYEKEHAADFRRLRLKVKPNTEVVFGKNTPQAALVVTQKYTQDIPDTKVAISSKNALLGMLK